MTSESSIQALIRSLWTSLGGRVFRNNVGEAWAGKHVRLSTGIVIAEPYRVNFGLCVGSSDLIGWRPLVITQEMVGRTVAQFTALEVKRRGKNPTVEQQAFLNAVTAAGGCAACVRSPADAETAFNTD